MPRIAVSVAILPILLALTPRTAIGDTNRALGILINPITTDTVEGNIADVTDGVFGEAWWTYQGGNYNTCAFTIDLGATYSINQIVIGQYQLYGYALYSSTDGSNWTLRDQADSGSYYNDPQNTLNEGGAYVARYFKYTSYTDWNQYIGVSEFQVYGDPVAAAPVPALSAWAAAALALLMLGTGLWLLRPRRA